MAGFGKAVESAPRRKAVGQIIVINQDVFSRATGGFSSSTFSPHDPGQRAAARAAGEAGDPYDEAVVQESIRNLQAPPSVSVAGRAVRRRSLQRGGDPAAGLPRPGEVDLLVVTRDVWSLRFNTNFEIQQQSLVLLETSLSENNLFGWRKYLSLEFSMDQGAMAVGPTYLDPNIKGTRLTLYASTMLTYARRRGNTKETARPSPSGTRCTRCAPLGAGT